MNLCLNSFIGRGIIDSGSIGIAVPPTTWLNPLNGI